MMKCEQAIPYLAAATDELDPVVASARDEHIATCVACSADAAKFGKLRASLAAIADREIEPPARLVPEILARTAPERRRTLPFVPVPIEVVRVVQENRETIAGAAGVALVAAGAAWALWRGMRAMRPARRNA
jgi:anti-sigma factor RsiW